MNKKESLPAPLNIRDHRDTTWKYRSLGNNLLLSQHDIQMLNALHPRCAKCGKPVEEFSWNRDRLNRIILFTVACHGQEMRQLVSFSELPAIMLGGVASGEVFGDPDPLAIEEVKKLKGE